MIATEILQIQFPLVLFGSVNYEEKLRKLRLEWHPDRNPDPLATKVMTHINHLADKASNGDWGNAIAIKEIKEGKDYILKFKKSRDIDTGRMLVGQKHVVFIDDSMSNQDLFESAEKTLNSIEYPSPMLRDTFKRMIPRDVSLMETETGSVLRMYKGLDQICLADLIEKNGPLTPGQTSWIVTGLFNFALFMSNTQSKMHGGIELSSVFVNPKFKSVHVLGGWFFSKTLRETLVALPSRITEIVSSRILSEKKASTEIDQISIRGLALRLLGDESMTGSRLLKNTSIRSDLLEFLRNSPKKKLLDDYRAWLDIEKTLSNQDIPMTFNDIYS